MTLVTNANYRENENRSTSQKIPQKTKRTQKARTLAFLYLSRYIASLSKSTGKYLPHNSIRHENTLTQKKHSHPRVAGTDPLTVPLDGSALTTKTAKH